MCRAFYAKYKNDVSMELIDKMKHLKAIYKSNLGNNSVNSDSSTKQISRIESRMPFPACSCRDKKIALWKFGSMDHYYVID